MCQRNILPLLLLFATPVAYSRSISSLASTVEEKQDPCSFSRGDYKLTWSYDELSSDVVFRLSAQSNLANFWSGVYMGEDAPTDAIGVFVRAGQIGLVDAHVTEDGIESDNLTNVQSLNFDLEEGGLLTAEFARPLSTNDPTDADLGGCTTFYFPVVSPQIDMGGPVDLPANMPSTRVCNIQEQCVAAQETSELVKRDDKPVCAYSNQKSSLSWRVSGDNLIFSVKQPAKKGKWWTAIGVGESMQDLSMVLAFTENGKLKKTGSYKTLGYGPPTEESSAAPGLTELNSAVKNNKAVFELSVGMDFLKKYTENGCTTLQVAILAGHYGKDFAVQKHEDTPLAIPICGIEQCTSEGATEADPPATEPEPINDKPKKNNKNNKHRNKHTEFPVEEAVHEQTTPPTVAPVVPEAAVEQQSNDDTVNHMNTDSPTPETGKGKGKGKGKNNKHNNKKEEEPVSEAVHEPTTPPAAPEVPEQQPQDNNTNQANPESNIELVAEEAKSPAVEGEGAQVRDEPLDPETASNETEAVGLESGIFGPAEKAVQEMNLTSSTVAAANAAVTTSGNWPIGGGAAQSTASSGPAAQLSTVGPVAAQPVVSSEEKAVSLPAGVVGAASVGTVPPIPEFQKSSARAASQSTTATQPSVALPSVVQQGSASQPTSAPLLSATQPAKISEGTAMQSAVVQSVVSTQPPVEGAVAQSTVSSVIVNRPTLAQPQADAVNERTQPTPAGAAMQSHSNATEGAAEIPVLANANERNGTIASDNTTLVENVNNATHVVLATTAPPAATAGIRVQVTSAMNTTVHSTTSTSTTAKPTATVTQTGPITTVTTTTTTVRPFATVTQSGPATSAAHTPNASKLPATVSVATPRSWSIENPATSEATVTRNTTVTTTAATTTAATTHKATAGQSATTGATSAPEAPKGNELRKDVPVDAPLEKNGLGSAEDLLEHSASSQNETTVTRVTGASVTAALPVPSTTTTVKHETSTATTTTVPMKTIDSRTGNKTVDTHASKVPQIDHPEPTTLQPKTAVTGAAGTSAGVPVGEGMKVPETCDQEDLMVCEGYFNDYLSKVKEWSDTHNHSVESQMWKACKLLSEVRHVPTLCCKRFKQDCAKELEKMPKN